jgi:DNA-binding MarR family transcriptional regulator
MTTATRDRLSPLELEAWGGFLRLNMTLHRELDRRLLKTQGISITGYEVLLRLVWAGRTLRMSELAEHVLMSSGGFTRLADRLERDGLIARERSADDLRGYEVRITPDGRRALKSANRRHLADVRSLFLDHVTDEELEVLARVWRRIKAANDAA